LVQLVTFKLMSQSGRPQYRMLLVANRRPLRLPLRLGLALPRQ
jgi:hypothetical protein